MVVATVKKRPLRAVKPGDRALPRVMSLADAYASGTKLEQLMALRVRTIELLSDKRCTPRDGGALSLRLEQLSRQIDELRGETSSASALIEPEAMPSDGDDGEFDPSAL